MHSCIYEGIVTHCRREPVAHQFQYRLFMVYLDLDELPSLLGRGGLIATNKLAICSFLRSDHLFNPSNTTYVKHWYCTSQGYHLSDYTVNDFTAGFFNTTTALNAISFKMSSGNMDGEIKMYGLL